MVRDKSKGLCAEEAQLFQNETVPLHAQLNERPLTWNFAVKSSDRKLSFEEAEGKLSGSHFKGLMSHWSLVINSAFAIQIVSVSLRNMWAKTKTKELSHWGSHRSSSISFLFNDENLVQLYIQYILDKKMNQHKWRNCNFFYLADIVHVNLYFPSLLYFLKVKLYKVKRILSFLHKPL